jgi:hypothetical protein
VPAVAELLHLLRGDRVARDVLVVPVVLTVEP